MDEEEIRTYLGSFLFQNDDVYKKISVLSGGEKVRLKLAILFSFKPNLLILDEVTNHIDIKTKEYLEEIFSMYEGTLIFVSHDRYFTEKIAKQMVLAIKKDGPSTMKDLGMLARLGTVYLNKKDYNVNPNEKELSIFKKLETKITNEKTVKQFLTDVRNDMQRVRDAKYEGYKNDMVELSVLAQDYMLDIDCKTNEEIIALQESELWINLCKRLNDLEAKINSKINTLYTVYSQEDSRVEDLATQLSVNKLDHTEELKLNLKKSK